MKYQLTWMPGPSPRWRKKYKGKIYYFSGQPSKTASYKPALEEWAKLKEQLDQESDPLAADRAKARKLGREVASIFKNAETRQVMSEIIGLDVPLAGADKPLLQPIIAKFLQEKMAEVDAGQISGGRYDNVRRGLEHFAGWHGERLCIDGNTIPDYRNHCLKKGARFAQDHLATAKQFIRFCWEREIIEQLPRTFKAAVKVETGKPKIWDLDVFRDLYEQCPDRLKLYLLLMMNCGMYSGDISDLAQDQVDWKKGTIHRSRSKTPDNDPTTWKLWPETFKLLKKFRSSDKERVLLTSTGKPLCVDELRPDGKRRRCDSIRQDILRWCDKANHPQPPPFKQVRKTGATLIGNKFGEPIAVEYLADSKRTVAQKFYIRATLDEALDWLRQEILQPEAKLKVVA